MTIRFAIAGMGVLLAVALSRADDWPQFRGPKRDGVSVEKGLLKAWPKEGPKLAWTFANAGLGFSSMAISGGKLYTLGTREKDEVVICLDALKGTELWVAKIAPIFTFKSNIWGDGPRSTPTIDGNRLYALGAQGELVCLDISGSQAKEVWRTNMLKDFKGEVMDSNGSWGYCESPLVDGKLLICTPGGNQGTLAALDKTTGKQVWRSTDMKQQAPYTSPMPATINGVRQYVQCGFISNEEGGFLNGVAADDGKLLWSTQIVPRDIYNIAVNPVVRGNKVYQTTDSGGSHLFEIGEGNKVRDLYPKANKVLQVNHGGVVLVGDHVYGHVQRGWDCQEFKTGKRAWSGKNFGGQKSGSTIAADGMLYLYTDDGEIGLAEANPKEFNLVSNFTIPKRSSFPKSRKTSGSTGTWAYPAVANGRLYLRDAEYIFCYDIADKK